MPSKSAAQARLMAAVAHDPKFAAKVGIPQKVGEEFNQADEGTNIRKKKAAVSPHSQSPLAQLMRAKQ